MKRVLVVTAITVSIPVIAGLELYRRYTRDTKLKWNPVVAEDVYGALEKRYTELMLRNTNRSRVGLEFIALTEIDVSFMHNRYGHCRQYAEWNIRHKEQYRKILTRFD